MMDCVCIINTPVHNKRVVFDGAYSIPTASMSDKEMSKKPKAAAEFKVFNSMNNQKEIFKPKEDGKVRMYVCGVTSYDFSHIGHARAYISFDLLLRFLKYLGYEVVYVRNFTDIDDKIIGRANERGEDPISLSSRFCEEFLHDMDDLQCLPPTYQPRVSDHIDQVREMIGQIFQNGCAYQVDGDVYFSVDNFPNYGRLVAHDLGGNQAGERVAVDPRKRNPADFAMWKAAKPGEPSWDSPWGPGRPGWHIECSAMSAFYLTHSFDIHGGGMELKFPHHENELAESCAAHPDSDVKYWVHNGFVTNGGKKMSKSLGNFVTIREVTSHYHPLALRLYLLGMHYRSPLNYSHQQLDNESESLFYMYQTLIDAEDVLKDQEDALKDFQEKEISGKETSVDSDSKECIHKLLDEFEAKMCDDLHASPILNVTLLEALKSMNKSLYKLKKKMQKPQRLVAVWSLYKLQKAVSRVLDVLGLLPQEGYYEALLEMKSKALVRGKLSEEEVMRNIEERKEARRKKDYSRGDEIRISLAAKGITLMDVGMETFWRPCVPVPMEVQPAEQIIQPVTSTEEEDQHAVAVESSPTY